MIRWSDRLADAMPFPMPLEIDGKVHSMRPVATGVGWVTIACTCGLALYGTTHILPGMEFQLIIRGRRAPPKP